MSEEVKTSNNDLSADKVLAANIGKLNSVFIVGYTSDGKFHMDSYPPTFEYAHSMLNRATFRLNALENQLESQQLAEKQKKSSLILPATDLVVDHG